jgi:3-oxoacyl-(acyl-carrier-protein) synthase
MSALVLSHAIATPADLPALTMRPEFRKASASMLLAYHAVNSLLAPFAALSRGERQQIGLVLGSSNGEFEVTKDFLKALGQENIARPFLFQKSLHNSTLGFLSLQFQLSGPGMTVSNVFFSGEDAIAASMDLLEAQRCSLCIAVAVDTMVPELEGVRNLTYPAGLHRGEGAAAILLATEAGLKNMSVATAATAHLKSLTYSRHPRATDGSYLSKFKDFYDADGIRQFSLAMQGDKSERREPLQVDKPDGTCSRFDFSWL